MDNHIHLNATNQGRGTPTSKKVSNALALVTKQVRSTILNK